MRTKRLAFWSIWLGGFFAYLYFVLWLFFGGYQGFFVLLVVFGLLLFVILG